LREWFRKRFADPRNPEGKRDVFGLVCRAYIELIRMELSLFRRNFVCVHVRVRSCPTAKVGRGHATRVEALRAVDLACVFYFKEVLCLQRSAAATCLLRKHGVRAEMVIGVQHIPFRAHAWVEIDGSVVNDKPYVTQMYAVLERC
jgi:Transglutaminase-like superfamily